MTYNVFGGMLNLLRQLHKKRENYWWEIDVPVRWNEYGMCFGEPRKLLEFGESVLTWSLNLELT